MKYIKQCLSIFLFVFFLDKVVANMPDCKEEETLKTDTLMKKSKYFIPKLNSGKKGDAGKIGVIGGSIEYTGAPYFAAISALKVGADLVYVITTSDAAPVIKSYSPELIVYPFLEKHNLLKIQEILHKMDIIIIGPGLGRENETMTLIHDVIKYCRNLKKPLVLDADALYAVSVNLDIIKEYPSPGVVLTPNIRERDRLINMLKEENSKDWYKYWGETVSILVKDQEDKFHSACIYQWTLSGGGSGRRAGGQGDILSGALGTFFNWAIKKHSEPSFGRAVSAYSAPVFTRECNSLAYAKHGRSMTASDMLVEIHAAFEKLFEN